MFENTWALEIRWFLSRKSPASGLSQFLWLFLSSCRRSVHEWTLTWVFYADPWGYPVDIRWLWGRSLEKSLDRKGRSSCQPRQRWTCGRVRCTQDARRACAGEAGQPNSWCTAATDMHRHEPFRLSANTSPSSPVFVGGVCPADVGMVSMEKGVLQVSQVSRG